MLNRLRFSAVWWPGLLSLSLALAACSAQTTATPAEPAAETPTQAAASQAAEDTPTTEAQETPIEVAAAKSPVATPAETAVAAAKPVVCQPVEVPTNSKIAPISDKDWAKGPATAPVTLIEYGDFQ